MLLPLLPRATPRTVPAPPQTCGPPTDAAAERNASRRRAAGLLVLNVLSAQGPVKTALRSSFARQWRSGPPPRAPPPHRLCGVIVVICATDNDRHLALLRRRRSVQESETWNLCLLRRAMVGRAFDQLEPRAGSC